MCLQRRGTASSGRMGGTVVVAGKLQVRCSGHGYGHALPNLIFLVESLCVFLYVCSSVPYTVILSHEFGRNPHLDDPI